VGIPLSGHFKARSQDQRHILIPVAYETNLGLRPGVWAERLLALQEAAEITTGWLFRTATGEQRRLAHFEDKFYALLLRAQQTGPSLFPAGIDVTEDYHLSHSHRRGATTRATEAGVAKEDIEWIDRWNIGLEE
jgi:hypothetical protein